jgi:hypothetical protein
MNKEQVLGTLRHSLTFLGGLLVAQGLVDDTIVAELSGAIITLIGGIWSILVKK